MKSDSFIKTFMKYIANLFCKHKVVRAEKWRESGYVPVLHYVCEKCGRVKFSIMLYEED